MPSPAPGLPSTSNGVTATRWKETSLRVKQSPPRQSHCHPPGDTRNSNHTRVGWDHPGLSFLPRTTSLGSFTAGRISLEHQSRILVAVVCVSPTDDGAGIELEGAWLCGSCHGRQKAASLTSCGSGSAA